MTAREWRIVNTKLSEFQAVLRSKILRPRSIKARIAKGFDNRNRKVSSFNDDQFTKTPGAFVDPRNARGG